MDRHERTAAFLSLRQVALWAEFNCYAVCDHEGEGFVIEDLPVSATLQGRFTQWISRMDEFERSFRLDDDPLDVRVFAEEGYKICVAIKQELPDWRVSYCDETYAFLAPDGNVFPEVLVDGSLGQCILPRYMGRLGHDAKRHHALAQIYK